MTDYLHRSLQHSLITILVLRAIFLSSITADKLLIFTFLLKEQDSVLLDMANTWLVELTIHGAKKNVVLSLVIILCITEVDL